MNQRLWEKLQRVNINDLIHIIYFLVALPISKILRIYRKDLWLVCDNGNEARDNGYWLYRYVVDKYPQQDIIYAINKKSPDYDRVKNIGQVVQYGSLTHWIYYLAASKNISSQKGGKPNAAVCYVLEVYGIIKNTRIFLQHGIINNDLPFLYYKNTKMRLFVCSTKRECDYVSAKYGYPKGWVKELGLCRFDMLHQTRTPKRQILVMPTWRNWIGRPTTESYKIENISKIENTEYFRKWNEFLSNIQLNKLLREENIQLCFYPHRDMQRYLRYFKLYSEFIKVLCWPSDDVQELLIDSALLITDYSSVAMDFAYMKKPLLYYQFDYEKFRKGHYPEGYFSYENDGFGKVCYKEDELIYNIIEIIKRNFKNLDKYIDRQKCFFTTYDTNNCERNYQEIKRI